MGIKKRLYRSLFCVECVEDSKQKEFLNKWRKSGDDVLGALFPKPFPTNIFTCQTITSPPLNLIGISRLPLLSAMKNNMRRWITKQFKFGFEVRMAGTSREMKTAR